MGRVYFDLVLFTMQDKLPSSGRASINIDSEVAKDFAKAYLDVL